MISISSPPKRSRTVSGYYSGTGASQEISIGVDLTAVTNCLIIVKANSDPYKACFKIGTQPNATYSHFADATAYISTGITGLTANGFTVGADDSVNKLLTVYRFTCIYER